MQNEKKNDREWLADVEEEKRTNECQYIVPNPAPGRSLLRRELLFVLLAADELSRNRMSARHNDCDLAQFFSCPMHVIK